MVQERYVEKNSSKALFMNVKEVFNHISRNQLLKCIIDLDIDGNLVA